MSVLEIKENIRKLSPNEWRDLASYLVTLRHESIAGYRDKLAEQIDDSCEENWVTLAEFDKRLSQ